MLSFFRRKKPQDAPAVGKPPQFSAEELASVIAHEIGHVANGDMVTLALLQGVLNAVVILLARALGLTVDRAVFGTRLFSVGYACSI